MTGESIPPQQLEEQPEVPVSFEALTADPELYRNRLITLLKSLPWQITVTNVQGKQAQDLVGFCLDLENVDPIEPFIEKLTTEEPEDPVIKEILDGFNSAEFDRFGRDRAEMRREQRLRLRLLAWVDFLGAIITGHNGGNGDPLDGDSSAA